MRLSLGKQKGFYHLFMSILEHYEFPLTFLSEIKILFFNPFSYALLFKFAI
jgi:hypothetical protein